MKKRLLIISILIIASVKLNAQTILGIDVSHYQGAINWTQVAAAGKSFAWTKATEGISYTDPSLTTYMVNGTNAGVVMGAYHFARPETNTATAEANYFVSVANSYIANGYLPPALDLEDPPSGTALTSYFTSAALTSWVQTWMTTVQNQTGVTPVIYTSPSIAGYLNSSLNTYGLWIASPGTSSTTPPSNTGVWTTWAFKQYSWTGAVSGITGDVDLDVFHGTTTDFNNLIGGIINPCTAPVNDNCSAATAIISNGACLTGTVECSNGSYGANQCSGCTCTSLDDYDVYYQFQAQATSHTVNISNYSSDFDVVIELRTACAYNTALGCYDPTGIPISSSYTWNNLTIGQTYYIRVFEYNYGGTPPSSPSFDICVTHQTIACTSPTSIVNDVSGTSPLTMTCTASGGSGGSYSYKWYSGTSCSGTVLGTNSTLAVTQSGNYACLVYITGNENTCYSCDYGYATITTPTLDCNGAIPLTCGQVYNGNNTGGNSNVAIYNCTNWNEYGPEIVHTITTNATSDITATLSNMSVDLDVFILSSCNVSSCQAFGGIAATYSNAPAGTYYIVVEGYHGTQGSYTLTVNSAIAAPIIIANGPVTFCQGGNVTLTSSSGSSYLWSPGSATTQAITSSSSGSYTVSVPDPNGCGNLTSTPVQVTSNPDPTASFSFTQNDPTIDFTGSGSGGTPGYNFAWNFGDTNIGTGAAVSHTYVTPNTYTVQLCVNDAVGCANCVTHAVTILPTDVDDHLGINKLTVYPNPSTANFIISGETTSGEDFKINFCNLLSEVIYSKQVNDVSGKFSIEINPGDVTSGIYLLQLKNGKVNYTMKVIIQK